jgi:hypothetical protein
MLKEIPELRAPEKRRTGMEINPKVRYPDQTEDAIVHPATEPRPLRVESVSLDYNVLFLMQEARYGNPVLNDHTWGNPVVAHYM